MLAGFGVIQYCFPDLRVWHCCLDPGQCCLEKWYAKKADELAAKKAAKQKQATAV